MRSVWEQKAGWPAARAWGCGLRARAASVALASCLLGCGGASSSLEGSPSSPPRAAARASVCAAVVSVTLPQKADLLFGEKHVALLLDLDTPAAEAVVSPGVVVRNGERLERLARVSRVREGSPFHDEGWSEWAALGPSGAIARIVARGDFAEPFPFRKDDGPTQHHSHLDVSLTSVIGPFVSVQRQVYEFRENGNFEKPYHGGFYAKQLSTGKPLVWPPALLEALLREVNADLASMSRERAAKGEPPLERVESLEGNAMLNLAFGVPGTGPIVGPMPALSVLSSSCCKEKGSFEHVKRGTELMSPPAELGALVSFDEAEPGLVRAPNGCGAVGVREGKVVLRRAKGPVEQAFRPGVDRLVAVTWLGDGELELAKALPRAAVSAADHATLAYRLHATSAFAEAEEAMKKAVALEPESPLWLRDLGRMTPRYSVKKGEEEASLEAARGHLEKALSLATSKGLRASILYHLGDVARRRGQRDRAAQLFERSIGEMATGPAESARESLR
jgi:tetratricopeptide (TPR) repeat protein